MAIQHYLDKEKGIAYSCWTGMITASEFLEQTRRNINDPDWPPARGLLLADLRHASVDKSFDATFASQVINLYLPHQDKVGNLRAAIVAQGLFEKAKIFEKIVAGYTPSVIVFNDIDTACVWLGIDVKAADKALQLLREKAQKVP